jgi:hypothetical protein
MDGTFWTDQLAAWIGGRRVILTTQVAAAVTPTVDVVRRLGATEVLVLDTHGPGTGPTPECARHSLGLDATGLTLDESIHQSQAAWSHLPPDAVAALDEFDPDRDALVIGDFLTESPELAGRPFVAHRRPEWLALDDKTQVDAFWDRAGVRRAASAVVEASAEAVGAVWRDIDLGDGVVLAVDATHGWTGGAEGTRPVRTREGLDAALAGWAGRRVRVSPFLEGVPCSIHGIVYDDHVAAFRPVELVVLRRAEQFFYAGCSSFWDPPAAAREQMRAVARTAGEQLRAEVAYRGAFTVDGVLTADGFLPTELNPRNGAGFATMARTLDLPVQLLLDALVGGVQLDWRPAQLEALLLAHFDAQRAGGTWRMVPVVVEPRELVHGDDHGLVGKAVAGSFVRMPMERPPGTFIAPDAARFWHWADAELGLGIGMLGVAEPRWT